MVMHMLKYYKLLLLNISMMEYNITSLIHTVKTLNFLYISIELFLPSMIILF